METAGEAEIVEGLREQQGPGDAEGDFSPRKLKIAAGVLIGQSFATSILPYSALPLLMIPQTREFGWSRTEFSWAVTFLFIFGAASLWPIGRLADRIGVRPVLLGGTAMVGLITLAMSLQTRSLTQFYIYYALLGIFGSTGVTYMKVVAALFTQNRGKAMAILGAESTVAMSLVPLFTNWLLLSYGWRHLYWVFGSIILAAVPILFFTLDEPGQRGTAPRWRRQPAQMPAPKPPRLDGMTIREALGDWVFWMILLAGLPGMFMFNGMLAHMVPAIMAKGFSQTTAAEMISMATFFGLGGTLVGGWAVDRFHTARIAVPFCLLAAAGAVLLLVVTAGRGGLALLAIATGLGGFTFTAFRPMGTYFQTRFFGLGSFTEIMAVQYAITNPVTAFAAPIVGYTFDVTHTYTISFSMMIGAWVLSAAAWAVLPRYRYAANIGQSPA
ncbi:MAG: MFS transporter [Alphaproteobacteria bacterium]|nr:MFS transporter [Alphaproteobacteria bacterium]